MPKIVAITGQKYAGKDTAADYLVTKYGYKKFEISEPLKKICAIMFGFSEEQLHGTLKETVDQKWRVSPRQALQFIGTDLFRYQIGRLLPNVGANIWTDILINAIDSSGQDKVVISGIRFQDEIDELKRRYENDAGTGTVVVIKIKRPGLLTGDKHISETGVEDIIADITIYNDSSLSDMYDQLDKMF